MVVGDVGHIIEQWAARGAAWERDNVGLQVGDAGKRVARILVALDATDAVVQEAKRGRVDLIVTHHPLLFRPPKAITADDRIGKIIASLIRHDIALYSAHTNFDFTHGGVSFALAQRLGLRDITFLQHQREALRKIVVFVPAEHVEKVADAMASAGGGIIGKYDHCSFRSMGTGTFRGGEETKPFVGEAGQFEQVQETRLEMLLPRWKVGDVVRAMKKVHPYEEVAYDVYVLENESMNFGAGAVGTLPRALSLKRFLQAVKKRLNVRLLRYAGELKQRVSRVAVCGGSGSDLVDSAVAKGAEAFVTADVKYHTFEAAAGRIALVDAGHFETEMPSLDVLVEYLRRQIAPRDEGVRVLKSSAIGNPVHYY